MGARTAVTDADGQYRLTAVPPGDHTLLFELSGFASGRNEGINLQWSSGTAFNRPLKIVPPRLARIGLKLNF